MKVLLLGASGVVGNELLGQWLEQAQMQYQRVEQSLDLELLALSRKPPKIFNDVDTLTEQTTFNANSKETHPNKELGHQDILFAHDALMSPWSWKSIDLKKMLEPHQWEPYLQGVDVIINVAGIISEEEPGDFERIHLQAPAALFKAGQKAGVKYILQLSALGSHLQATTGYAQSKAKAEFCLQNLGVPFTVVEPSLIYAEGGVSSELFKTLASLPCVMLPYADSSRVAPIHVKDLVSVMISLVAKGGLETSFTRPLPAESIGAQDGEDSEDAFEVTSESLGKSPKTLERSKTAPLPLKINASGPQTLSLSSYLKALSHSMGLPPVKVLNLPLGFVSLLLVLMSVWANLRKVFTWPHKKSERGLGGPVSPINASVALNQESLMLLSESSGLTYDHSDIKPWLRRPFKTADSFVSPEQGLLKIQGWSLEIFRVMMIFIWLYTAYISWFIWPQAESQQWLIDVGVPANLSNLALRLSCITDAALGVLLCFSSKQWVWRLQAALVGFYTLWLTITASSWWLHPLGPISKNVPLCLILLLLSLYASKGRGR